MFKKEREEHRDRPTGLQQTSQGAESQRAPGTKWRTCSRWTPEPSMPWSSGPQPLASSRRSLTSGQAAVDARFGMPVGCPPGSRR